jgi:protease I
MKLGLKILAFCLIFATISFFGSGCKKEKTPQIKNMAQGKKILMVIASKDFRDEEYFTPRKILEDAGIGVFVASLETGKAFGSAGGKTNIDLAASEVRAEDYDGVAFIGGQGMVDLVSNSDFINLAKEFYDAGKLTTAICIAPVILANAGILKNKKATVCGGAEEEVENGGAVYTGKPVEIDGKIITANGPAAAEEFGKAIVETLK